MSAGGEFTWGHLDQDAYGGQSVEYKDMYPASYSLARPTGQMAMDRTKDFYERHKERIWCGIAGLLGGAIVGGIIVMNKKNSEKGGLLYSGHKPSSSMYRGKMYSTPMSYSHQYF